MAKKYDVIVVGAGPAGFLAAKAAGENGFEVALLERKSDPPDKSPGPAIKRWSVSTSIGWAI